MKRLTYRDEEGTPHWSQELMEDDTGWAGELIRSTVADMEDVAEKPRLNRKAWRAEWVEKTDDDGCVWFECSACEQGLDSMDEQHPFCPSCGRAMTDAAWEMLERRIARHEQQ